MTEQKEPSWKLIWIAAGITALILVGWLRGGELNLGRDDPRRTIDGEVIQSNGLTATQEAEIRVRCADKPQSLGCR